MQVYRYVEEDTSRFALTRDRGGAKLPVTGAVWRYAGPVTLDDEKPSARVSLEILRKGYFLWPDDAEGPGDEVSFKT
jgi:hypothetical protein